MGNVSFNPMTTTGIPDGFVLSTDGYVQGTFLDDPANRYNLEGGYVADAQSQPLWGGLAATLAVPAVGVNAQGPALSAAGSLSAINAWTLFNQASAGIITPTSNVPLYASGMSINFARPGSNLRICLAVLNTTVLNALVGAEPNVALYWDPVNLCLTNSSSGTYGPLPVQLEALSITSKTVSYSSPNATWNPTGAAAIVRI